MDVAKLCRELVFIARELENFDAIGFQLSLDTFDKHGLPNATAESAICEVRSLVLKMLDAETLAIELSQGINEAREAAIVLNMAEEEASICLLYSLSSRQKSPLEDARVVARCQQAMKRACELAADRLRACAASISVADRINNRPPGTLRITDSEPPKELLAAATGNNQVILEFLWNKREARKKSLKIAVWGFEPTDEAYSKAITRFRNWLLEVRPDITFVENGLMVKLERP